MTAYTAKILNYEFVFLQAIAYGRKSLQTEAQAWLYKQTNWKTMQYDSMTSHSTVSNGQLTFSGAILYHTIQRQKIHNVLIQCFNNYFW